MKAKKSYALIAVISAALMLSGWSCGNGYSVSNNQPDTGNGPQTYANSGWGVSFQYPAGWQYREYSETIEGQEVTTLAFSDQELPDTLPPEPSFPVMVFRGEGMVETAMSDYVDASSVDDVTIGSKTAKKVIYYNDFLEQNEIVYLTPLRSGFLKFFVPEGTSQVSVAENMISTLSETE